MQSTNLDSLSIILTDICNFSCDYCYQKCSEKLIDDSIINSIIENLLPYVTIGGRIVFGGGEVLMFFPLLKRMTQHLYTLRNDLRFSVTTNGSLISEEIVDFFDDYKFEVMVSYDGYLLQDRRQKGSRDLVLKAIQQLNVRSNISLSTNSVFERDSVQFISSTLVELGEMGVDDIQFACNTYLPWTDEQIDLYRDVLVGFIDKYHDTNWFFSIVKFYEWKNGVEGSITSCGAGNKTLAVAPDGDIYGCFRFADLCSVKKDSDLDDFLIGTINDSPEIIFAKSKVIAKKCKQFRIDQFYTTKEFCVNCESRKYCWSCPVKLKTIGNFFDKVPDWICKYKKADFFARRFFNDCLS